jgi:hypothetical protein
MTAIISGSQLRTLLLGNRVAATSYSIATETKSLFTVSGGTVLVTSLVGLVTTAMTVANTIKLQANPTTGVTGDLCAATDLGTTDTLAGNLISFQGLKGDSAITNVGAIQTLKAPIAVAAGAIEQVTTGTSPDGAITWVLTYIPWDDGAAVAAV